MNVSSSKAITAALLAALPLLASAQLTGNVSLTTNYKFRGQDQDATKAKAVKPALQGGFDYAFGDSGWYVGNWNSSVDWLTNNSLESDLYGGYKFKAGGVDLDVGLLTYIYPGNSNGNTTELYGAATLGPATLKYSHSVSNLFGFANSKNSGYLDLSASFDLGDGWSLAPHIGRQRVAHNSLYSYTDYSLAVNKDIDGLVLSATLVGTDADQAAYTTSAAAGGKFLGKSGLLLSVKKNF